MALSQIAIFTCVLGGLVQILMNRIREFQLDCDERIELAKIKLKLAS